MFLIRVGRVQIVFLRQYHSKMSCIYNVTRVKVVSVTLL